MLDFGFWKKVYKLDIFVPTSESETNMAENHLTCEDDYAEMISFIKANNAQSITTTTAPAILPVPVCRTTDGDVYDYFDENNLEIMMEYFVTLLCINVPEDPYEYIQSTCEKMLRVRTNPEELENLDRIFEPEHILGMFSLFDKEQRKFITMQQYKAAMDMLGVIRYNPHPTGFEQNIITEEVFYGEATKALEEFVKELIA